MIVLDTASPGSAEEIIADCAEVGAAGVAFYLRDWPGWTPALVDQLLAAGLGVLPVELFNGQSPRDTLGLLQVFQLPPGPVALDVETGSWPSDPWQLQWQAWVDDAGYTSVGYSQAAASVPYRRRWGAAYGAGAGRTNVQPVIPIPQGLDALQYAHDVVVGGRRTYDASNFGFPLISRRRRSPMLICDSSAGEYLLTGGLYVHIQSPATVQALTAAGVQAIPIDDGTHAGLVVQSSRGAVAGSLTVGGTLTVS